MKENWDILFIKPCRNPNENPRQLTPEYIKSALFNNKIVQINLDNCSIQRMEMLSGSASLKEVNDVGLLPLVNLLNSGLVTLSAIGINEMPDCRVTKAKEAYELFCKKFWPGHKDDQLATQRIYDKDSIQQKIKFSDLDDGSRTVYGAPYISILLIQKIKLKYNNCSPEKQFEFYIYGVINLLNIISGFELEIAKYAFWKLSNKEINQLPESIKKRRKDIKENFTKSKSTLNKCQEFAFDAAMDIHWLSSANFAEDLGLSININGKTLQLDNWVGTNDYKLYRISLDIHSVYFQESKSKLLAVTREKYLDNFSYWKSVDDLSNRILKDRLNQTIDTNNNLTTKIDFAISYIENELSKQFI